MPKRKFPRKAKSQDPVRLLEAVEHKRAYILSGRCLKTVDLYPELLRQGLICGCPECYPLAWCAFQDADGRRCREPRCYLYEAALYPYCYEHYRRVVLNKGLESVGAIINEMCTPGVDKGV
jgi:hypothetical protein